VGCEEGDGGHCVCWVAVGVVDGEMPWEGDGGGRGGGGWLLRCGWVMVILVLLAHFGD
jgi:hypothetical protein